MHKNKTKNLFGISEDTEYYLPLLVDYCFSLLSWHMNCQSCQRKRGSGSNWCLAQQHKILSNLFKTQVSSINPINVLLYL